jgi:3-oxoadipate enol-lactonase
MPTISANGVDLFYKESGPGPETIVFSHGFLMDHDMFEPQRAVFESQYRVIAYDHRAQGQSQDPGSGYDMDTLAEDAAALIRGLNAAPCHFAGLSMGGFVGMRLAARHPELVRTLTLMNTTATKENLANRVRYGVLAQLVKVVSPGPFTPIAVRELFGRTTRTSPARREMLQMWTAKLRARPKNIAPSLLAVMKPARVPRRRDGCHRLPYADHYRRRRYRAAAAQLRQPGRGHSRRTRGFHHRRRTQQLTRSAG